MAFDIKMIKGVYNRMTESVDDAKKVVGKPLTLTEKILYNHHTLRIIMFLNNLLI